MLTEIWSKNGVLCVFVTCMLIVKCENIFSETLFELEAEEKTQSDITGTLFKTVKIYNYSLEECEDAELLLYGYKAWSFPVQDVNLTLKYPTADENESVENQNERVITEFQVIIYIDGDISKAVITSGGLLEDNVVFTFTFRNVTRLGYKIWLYGLPRSEIVDYNIN